MNFHKKKYIVTSNEIDEYEHVNNVVYVQWMQEVSNDHWLLITKDIAKTRLRLVCNSP